MSESVEIEFRRHLRNKADGRCAACGEPAPCARRRELAVKMGRAIVLPARVPGAADSIAARGRGA